jgi:hypothetical protein
MVQHASLTHYRLRWLESCSGHERAGIATPGKPTVCPLTLDGVDDCAGGTFCFVPAVRSRSAANRIANDGVGAEEDGFWFAICTCVANPRQV